MWFQRCCYYEDLKDLHEPFNLFTRTWVVWCYQDWTPFSFRNLLYSSHRNGGPSSLTTLSGRPNLAKMVRSAPIVASTAVVAIGPMTSGHLEWASTTMRWCFPWKVENQHVFSATVWWATPRVIVVRVVGCCGSWHSDGSYELCLLYLCLGWASKNWLRAIVFILAVPGWVSWSSSRSRLQKEGRVITLRPHLTHPLLTESSFLLKKYGLNADSPAPSCGHPTRVKDSTLDRIGSFAVSRAMFTEETGNLSSRQSETWNRMSLGYRQHCKVSQGSLDRASALTMSLEFRTLMP